MSGWIVRMEDKVIRRGSPIRRDWVGFGSPKFGLSPFENLEQEGPLLTAWGVTQKSRFKSTVVGAGVSSWSGVAVVTNGSLCWNPRYSEQGRAGNDCPT